jgi:hypothetical protein
MGSQYSVYRGWTTAMAPHGQDPAHLKTHDLRDAGDHMPRGLYADSSRHSPIEWHEIAFYANDKKYGFP